MSDFVNRYETENLKPAEPSVKDSMGYFPQPQPGKSCVKDSVGYLRQPPADNKDVTGYCPHPPKNKAYQRGPAVDISVHFSRSVTGMDKDTKQKLINEFRSVDLKYNQNSPESPCSGSRNLSERGPMTRKTCGPAWLPSFFFD